MSLLSLSTGLRASGAANISVPGNEFGMGVYNSSQTPSSLPWNTYNYCNAPHVNAAHYSKPTLSNGDGEPELVYVNAIIRHHKRTPDNLYPNEAELNPASGWDCSDIHLFDYAQGTVPIIYETDIPSWHPFLARIWNGTCDEGQLTAEGLKDAIKHGQDFWSVYHTKLGFLENVDEADILVRTPTEPRTKEVAGGFLFGMDPRTAAKPWNVVTQPSVIDSIPPNYACSHADAIRDAYQSVPAWTDHLQANEDLKARLDATLGTTGLADWASWYDHFFDTFTSRTCHGHPLPCNSTSSCVSEDDANKVHAIGDFEYNYIWNAAQNATEYVRLTFGAFFTELAMNFNAFKSGSETYKLRFYVGHDGSIIRLTSGLGFGKVAPLRWPALGSEIVMEVWQTPKTKERFVRVIYGGTPVQTLEWVALDDFISLLESNVPDNLLEACSQ
ncbi:phosphoglycerate mutase-like protein [Fomitiporia mediterranea MF3/22]|uniref:phosphoglycerate mutase-like protein n=1 Tax=Fomitiporia mediterranea (strain MF3/22) TaxID=694068 RepID=UPI0004409CAA|nr:phosphoglycerate mutase-like protein [Fomitiporia mediterranea MF3/22]EJD04724.1 phosphoglycerate mutase-like protein [Fomitiporia mediterranea MF3/22]